MSYFFCTIGIFPNSNHSPNIILLNLIMKCGSNEVLKSHFARYLKENSALVDGCTTEAKACLRYLISMLSKFMSGVGSDMMLGCRAGKRMPYKLKRKQNWFQLISVWLLTAWELNSKFAWKAVIFSKCRQYK